MTSIGTTSFAQVPMRAPERQTPNGLGQRPLRILMASDFYPPVIGGLERHVQLLAHALAERGHQISVLTSSHEQAAALEYDGSVQVHRVPGWRAAASRLYESAERPFHPPAPDPGVVRAMRRLIRAERPDIVHTHGWILYSALVRRSEPTPRIVATLHDYGLVCAKRTYLHQGRACAGPAYAKCVRCAAEQYGPAKSAAVTTSLFASRLLHGRVDRYIANSAAVAEASARWVPGGRAAIDVIHPFLPEHLAETARRSERPAFVPSRGEYILFVGALGRHKGVHTLLEAHSKLGRPVPLVLVGTRRSDTPTRFPDGAILVEDAPHPDVMAAWAHCAVAVVPSLWPEPFGQVALEAMACGRPVVASGIGGLRDIVSHGETGFLVPPGEADQLAAALRTLLGDPKLRRRMGEAGRRQARAFGVAEAVAKLERVYTEVTAEA